MTNTGRILVLSLAVALPLALPGCTTGGIPTSEGLSVRVEPSELEFTHVVGQSPCPQLVGRVKVTNTSRTRTTTDFRSLAPAPLTFGAGRATTLEPGESVTVDVFFNCASRTSFVTTVDVIGQNGSGFSQFTVRGTIVQ